MSSIISDKVTRQEQEAFVKLRSKRRSLLRTFLLCLAVVLTGVVIYNAIQTRDRAEDTLERARQELISTGLVWARSFSSQQRNYRDWFLRHGIKAELNLFERASELLFRSAATLGPKSNDKGGNTFYTDAYLSAHFGVMRVCFLLIASWRLWIVALVAGFFWRARSLGVYKGTDILGQMGTGRLFYSGLRAGLDKIASNGAPDTQVIGLACPRAVSDAAARTSTLANILEKAGAKSATNIELIGIILHYKAWPAFVALGDEEVLLSKTFVGANLVEHTERLLQRVLDLYDFYQTTDVEADPDFLADSDQIQTDEEGRLSGESYADLLQRALHRVLTPEMRTQLLSFSKAELATIVLAFQAGKVMAYGFEGGKWLRKSNYPELSARALLHSAPAYGNEFDFQTRSDIRRALIYSSRSSVFGAVRFPVDFTARARAARQWVELLAACPHELQASADEVELVGLLYEMNTAWCQIFFDSAMMMNPEVIDGSYATISNLFLMPVAKVVELVRSVTPKGTLRRLEDLVALVNQKQRMQALSQDMGDPSIERGMQIVMSSNRVFAPLNTQELKGLSDLHGVSIQDIRDWSSIRVMFHQYGWLSRRVGEHSVPESSVIFAVLRFENSSLRETNELGLLGCSAMVAFRGTRLEHKWGRNWQSRFIQARSASMAETKEDFSRLLKGIEEPKPEEFPPSSALG